MDFLSFLRLRIVFILGILYMVFYYWEYFSFTYTSGVILLLCIHEERKRYRLEKKIKPFNKAVLITGCDTGFGNRLARRLDSKGFHIFASCLFPDGAGANDLRQTCSSRLQVLPLDVTKDESVTNALTFVKDNLGSNVLWAVVNNAGAYKGYAFDFSTIQHFKGTMDLNFLGPVRVTKAFLPLLKESKGRVINVTSLLGRIPLPAVCAYTVSKHALTALTECLRMEMNPWGVEIIAIEPELFRTQITEAKNLVSHFEDELKELDEDTVNHYGAEYVNKLKKLYFRIGNLGSEDIDIVVRAMESAVGERDPRRVYKPSRNLFVILIRFIVENMPTLIYETMYSRVLGVLGHPTVPKDKRLTKEIKGKEKYEYYQFISC